MPKYNPTENSRITMNRKKIKWDEEKNQLLKLQRGVNFDEVLEQIEAGKILGRKAHPNSDKYSNQEIFIIELKSYIYYVPFIENDSEVFLKTIIPSRKLNKIYGDNK
jgi:hypothetical protein